MNTGYHLIPIPDIAQLTNADDACLEFTGHFLSIHCNHLHRGPHHAAKGVKLLSGGIFIEIALRIDQSDSIELPIDFYSRFIVNDFSLIESFSNDSEKIVNEMLLVSIVIELMAASHA